MKVLFLRYYSSMVMNTPMPKSIIKAEGVFPPLGVAYVAAYAEKEGHDVKLLDCQALGMMPEEIKKYIADFHPDVVGITCTTPNVPGIIEAAQMTKDVDKDIIVVLGGPHLSVFPKEAVSFPFVDFGIQGEGEYAFAELLREIESGKRNFGSIKGLVWKNDDEIILNPPREPNRNLDDLPFPARHLLPHDKYHVVIMKHPMATMMAARGCPYHCAYCFRDMYTRSYRHRNAKSVVDEMEECVKKYGAKEISFYDDCFPNREFLSELCNEIINRGLKVPWNALQRVDLITKESLELMKKAGCIRIRFGVESGSERILKLMDKGITLKQVEDAFKMTREVGMETFAFFMVGYATETEEDFRATVNFAKKIDADWVMFDTTVPLPGTKLWDYAVQNNGYDPNYWKEWSLGKRTDPLFHFTKDAEARCGRAYREFYLRPKFILKKALTIRGLDDIRRYWSGATSIIRFEGHDETTK